MYIIAGVWKTYSEFGPAPFDQCWNNFASSASTPFFMSNMNYYQVLWTPVAGNNYYILAKQYIATELNILNGTFAPQEVLDGMQEVKVIFETYTPTQIGTMRRNELTHINTLGRLLESYNVGEIGSGHCDE